LSLIVIDETLMIPLEQSRKQDFICPMAYSCARERITVYVGRQSREFIYKKFKEIAKCTTIENYVKYFRILIPIPSMISRVCWMVKNIYVVFHLQ